jgi:superfamily II DNA/RNA helicase
LRDASEHEGGRRVPGKDTLDYLAGDGRDGRPLGKLREWGLKVTQIHGSMPIGDRDSPGTRIYAEREFREDCQVLVATEAAGEGINLQFCWLMINYDIPWNPVRLEQRMGRIHRYGQLKDCLIFNFVAVNTREGRVLDKLLHRLTFLARAVFQVAPGASRSRVRREEAARLR